MSRLRVALVVLVPTLLALALWGCGGDVRFASPDGGTTDASASSDATISPADGGLVAVDAAVAVDPCAALDGGEFDAPFAPSNFDRAWLDASVVVDIDISADASAQDGGCFFDTTALTLTCAHVAIPTSVNVVAQPADAGDLAVYTVGNFTIEPGAVVDAWGTRALVIDARGAVEIGGELRASVSVRPANGYSSPSPAGVIPLAANTLPGTVGSFCGLAGSRCVTSGSLTGCVFEPGLLDAGIPHGAPSLVPLGTATTGPFFRSGLAWSAPGGGSLEISSRSTLHVAASGLIDANGVGAVAGSFDFDAYFTTPGMSGGAILLEAPRIVVEGQLAANGGSGLAYDSVTSADASRAWGDAGAGAGSAGDDPNGEPPLLNATQFTTGGGGAGWIAVKARSCSIAGTVSPSLRSGCANLMPLAAP